MELSDAYYPTNTSSYTQSPAPNIQPTQSQLKPPPRSKVSSPASFINTPLTNDCKRLSICAEGEPETAKERQMTAVLETHIDHVIEKALAKVKASKTNELCRYLPGESGGYMHHFTFRRLKKQQPNQLAKRLTSHVLDVDEPKRLGAPPRSPRGSRKDRDKESLLLSRSDLNRLLKLARNANDERLMRAVRPQIRSLAQIKQELVHCIRRNEPARDLFEAFCERVETSEDEV